MIVKTYAINDILPNPYRNFKNYPVEEDQVERLMETCDELWHPLPARRLGNMAQLVFGHHRMEALRRLGKTHVELSISEFGEDDMVRMMVLENATQRGNSVVAGLDSMAAIATRLASVLLRYDTLADAKANENRLSDLDDLFGTEQAWGSAKGKLMRGNGIGHNIIASYIGENAFSKDTILNAITNLKESGQLKDIVTRIADVMAKEQEAARLEAERLEREAAEREAAEQARIKAAAEQRRKDAEEAERKAIERAKTAAARKKAEAEAREAREQERARRKAEEDKARAARQAEQKRAEAARLKAQAAQKRAEAAKLAAQEQREKRVDTAAITLFKTESHAREFRKAMATKEAVAAFDPSMHVEIAKEVIKQASRTRKGMTNNFEPTEMTAYRIGRIVEHFIREGKIVQERVLREVEHEAREEDPEQYKTHALWNDVQKATAELDTALQAFQDHFMKYPQAGDKVFVSGARNWLHRAAGRIAKLDKLLFKKEQHRTFAKAPLEAPQENGLKHDPNADVIDLN